MHSRHGKRVFFSSTSGLPAVPEPGAGLAAANTPRPGRKLSGTLLFLFALVPIFSFGFIFDRYGVNVPYADEWSNLILVENWDASSITFAVLLLVING